MLTALQFIIATSFIQCNSWDYDQKDANSSHWPQTYPECGYNRQSPIDVSIDYTSSCREPLELQWTSENSHYVVRNNGHSLQAIPFELYHAGGSDLSGLEVLHHRNDTNIRLTNSFYNTYHSQVHQEYCFDSLHFHWGRDNEAGSEHLINGKSYPLEVHLVHYSCDYYLASDALSDYQSGEAAVKYDDDNVLAVIGVMFEIGEANPVLDAMLDDSIMEGIHENNNKMDENHKLLQLYYTEFDLNGLLPDSREMVAYLGSLTTPPCLETVRWHLMKETMTVSEEQMDKFRMMLESQNINDSMAPNFRPILPINGRKIYQCQHDVDSDLVVFEMDDIEESEDVMDEFGINSKQWRLIAFVAMGLCVFTLIICCAVGLYCFRTWQQVAVQLKMKKARDISKSEYSHHDHIDHNRPPHDEEDEVEHCAHQQNIHVIEHGGGIYVT